MPSKDKNVTGKFPFIYKSYNLNTSSDAILTSSVISLVDVSKVSFQSLAGAVNKVVYSVLHENSLIRRIIKMQTDTKNNF